VNLTNHNARIYVAGHRGLVGSAVIRHLQKEGYLNLIARSSGELDLRNQAAVDEFFAEERPEFVVMAAARVGGILANSRSPVPFLRDNLAIELNVVQSAFEHGVKRLLFLGSSCVYPKLAPQPLKEEYLLTGALEPTNAWYAVAKIAGIKLCQAYREQHKSDFISAMPTNLYGPRDNFDLETSHVLPALIRKFHEAKMTGSTDPVVLWGTGTPRREFLYIEDMADACLFLLKAPEEAIAKHSSDGLINVGVGEDLTIEELALMVRSVIGTDHEIVFNPEMPDGTPRKLMDVSNMSALGWKAGTSLEEGIRRTYKWFMWNEEPDLWGEEPDLRAD